MTKTIGIVIVSEDILSGSAEDINLNYLTLELGLLNYQIKKVSVITCDESLVIFEIEHLLKQNDFVILIDTYKFKVIYKFIGKLFNNDLVPFCNMFDKNNCKSGILIPKYSKILKYENLVKVCPVVYLGRLFVIHDPNIKLVYENILKAYFKQFNKRKVFRKSIVLSNVTDVITLNNYLENCVQINCHRENNMLEVDAISSELDKLLLFEKYMKETFSNITECRGGSNLVDVYKGNCFVHIKQALDCIEKCLSDYGPEKVFVGFNGGKDCTVLLHLVMAVLRKKYPDYKGQVKCMYIQSSNPFEEVNQFIDQMRQYYHLDITTITKGVKEGLTTFLDRCDYMRACLMGTRRTDPFSQNLDTFQMTDPTWPQVMRVSPVLDWHYSEIWDYLLYFQVPYCTLYDEGYTSLGSVDNTIKNPDLYYSINKGNAYYLPAFKLIDGGKERSGRQ